MTMTTPRRHYQLIAKQLASDLGRHTNYVYAMTGQGFDGTELAEALRWIAEHGFVIVRGKPMIKPRTRMNAAEFLEWLSERGFVIRKAER